MTVLLVIIYLSFISLGLPDSIMGAAWPVVYKEFGVSIDSVGIFTMIVSGGTILSSLFSGKLLRRFGTGKLTAISVFMTAVGLLGIQISPGFIWICVLAIPLGLGAGAVDAGLNNFVAIHFEAKHMNWLHCFWGIGATLGPILMSLFIGKEGGWRIGYRTIGILQVILVVCIFASLPLWKKYDTTEGGKESDEKNDLGLLSILKIKGVKAALVTFFAYCSVEACTGLWGSSYLVNEIGLTPSKAARFVSFFYLGVTVGRGITGFIAMKVKNKQMVYLGQGIGLVGILLMAMPVGIYGKMIGIILIGLGCAPIYPALIHETPARFGKSHSSAIMGVQMATAYVGTTFMPPLLGVIAKNNSFVIMPFFLLVMMLVMIGFNYICNRQIEKE